LRLPTGIFYAIGVKTNVVFLTRGKTDRANTKGVWVYDLRANMGSFGKTKPLTLSDFAAFEKAFSNDPLGKSPRKDEGEEGRFRFFSREKIAERDDSLDIAWLRDTSGDPEDEMTEPEDIADAIMVHLRTALDEIDALNRPGFSGGSDM
jgi:type I restriction enzyme M protein